MRRPECIQEYFRKQSREKLVNSKREQRTGRQFGQFSQSFLTAGWKYLKIFSAIRIGIRFSRKVYVKRYK